MESSAFIAGRYGTRTGEAWIWSSLGGAMCERWQHGESHTSTKRHGDEWTPIKEVGGGGLIFPALRVPMMDCAGQNLFAIGGQSSASYS